MSSNKTSQELIKMYQMSERSQISRVALCMLESKGHSLSDSVKRSPIDWKAKKKLRECRSPVLEHNRKVVKFQDVGDCLLACYEQMLRDARGKITLISFDKLPYPIWASTTWLSFANRVNKITISKCQFIISSYHHHLCILCTPGKVLGVNLSRRHLVKEQLSGHKSTKARRSCSRREF